MEWADRSVLEAVSWRLASELVRRHPGTTRLIRAHPGGAQSDCLWILPTAGERGDVRLNRNGTIQVVERFDGQPSNGWPPAEWSEYIGTDPREFLDRFEAASGLPTPPHVPAATPTTLTYRVLAAIASSAIKTVHPIEIQSGFIDTSGYGGGPNTALDAFPGIPAELKRVRDNDLYGEPGYRFWIVFRDDVPVLAFEQSEGIAWAPHHETGLALPELYAESRRRLLVTVLTLLREADPVG